MVVYTKETNHCEPCNISDRVPSPFLTYQIATLCKAGAEETIRHNFLFFFSLFLTFLFLKRSLRGPRDSSVVLFTQTSAAVRREERDTWPPFGFYDASPIYDVPMVKNEAIII